MDPDDYTQLGDDPDCFPGSHKWVKLSAKAQGVPCWPDDEVPELYPNAPVLDRSRPAPLPPEDSSWLRVHQGALQRKVVLQALVQSPQYNGCEGWADIRQLQEPDKLVTVALLAPQRQVRVKASHIFLVGPVHQPQRPRHSLFTVSIKLHTPKGPVPVQALVDTGCELPGLIHPRLVSALELPLEPTQRDVRTASGEVVRGMHQASVQTHFAPELTRRISYGVLDIPGFDVILGEGFLRQCAPYHLACDLDGQRSITVTHPSSRRTVALCAERLGPLTISAQPLLASLAEEVPPAPVPLEMSWAVPSEADYANAVAVFSVILDPKSKSPVVSWAPDQAWHLPPPVDQDQKEVLASWELEEGLVFRLGAESMVTPSQVPESVRDEFTALLHQYRASVFQEREFPPFPPDRDVTFRIQLQEGAQIPASPVHKLSPALIEQLRTMLQELLHDGLIIPSTSPYAAPLLMVKKPDGSYRICIDYRKLNAVTVKDRYPLPNPAMIFDKLAGCKFFSKFDLRWAYFQVRVADEDVHKTTFRSPLGSFASRVMSMGLTNAAPTFQRLMDSIFGDLDFVSCYLDDVLIASRSAEEHLKHLQIVFERLHKHRLLARETKCAFYMSEIKFLGFVFSAQGKAVDSSKTAALRVLPVPDTVVELQRWLGAVNYYSTFIPHFADITAPLTDLLKSHPDKVRRKSKAKLEWLQVHQDAFEAIRAALASPPLLRLFDPALPCYKTVGPGPLGFETRLCKARSYSRELRLDLGGSLDDQLFCSMAKITPFAMYAICADSVHGKRRDLCHATKQLVIQTAPKVQPQFPAITPSFAQPGFEPQRPRANCFVAWQSRIKEPKEGRGCQCSTDCFKRILMDLQPL